MNTLTTHKTISIDELRRNFGTIKKELPFITFTLTDRGKPVGQLTATREMKKEQLMKTAGKWKGTELDDDKVWAEVLKKSSRKTSISL